MSYIVDGNNVIGQTPGWHRDKPAAQKRLLQDLAAFAKVKKARVNVVFDGAPQPGLPEASAYRGVKVFYPDSGSDADSRIEDLVESFPDRRSITVVTSDRRLARMVSARGASVVKSGEFRRQIKSVLDSKPIAQEGEQTDIGSIDEWLKYFGACRQTMGSLRSNHVTLDACRGTNGTAPSRVIDF